MLTTTCFQGTVWHPEILNCRGEAMGWRETPVRAWFAVLTLGVFGLVAVSMELQQMLRLAPCPLCIFQRLLYLAIGLEALAGVLLPGGRLLWSVLIAALALGGVAPQPVMAIL